MSQGVQQYAENGVTISKKSIKTGDEITLSYNGLLALSGADNVYAYVGYGENWEDNGFIPMGLMDGVFKCTFKIIGKDSLNVSFKDSADNWDNNSSNNYIFPIPKTVKKTLKLTEEKEKSEMPVKAKRVANVEKTEKSTKAEKTVKVKKAEKADKTEKALKEPAKRKSSAKKIEV